MGDICIFSNLKYVISGANKLNLLCMYDLQEKIQEDRGVTQYGTKIFV